MSNDELNDGGRREGMTLVTAALANDNELRPTRPNSPGGEGLSLEFGSRTGPTVG